MKVRRSGPTRRVLVAAIVIALLAAAAPARSQVRLFPVDIEIGNPAMLEGHSGTRFMEFHATLHERANETFEVNWMTEDGTATVANGDYSFRSGTLTFRPGRLTPEEGPIQVPVHGNTGIASDKTFNVIVRDPLTFASTTGTGTIVNDDFPQITSISASASPAIIKEGTAAQAQFEVKLNQGYHAPVTLDWRTVDSNGQGFAIPGLDYLPVARQTLTFDKDQDTAHIFVTLRNNTSTDRWSGQYLQQRDLMIELIPGSGYHVGVPDDVIQRRATVTLEDKLRVRIEDAREVEPALLDAANMQFKVNLSHAPSTGSDASVRWSTQDGTATAPEDYESTTSDLLSFATSETEYQIDVPIFRNEQATDDRTFRVSLGSPMDVVISRPQATGTIADRDKTPVVSVEPAAPTFENQGQMAFTVRLSRPTRAGDDEQVQVRVRTVPGTAAPERDYEPEDDPDFTFGHDVWEKTFDVTLLSQPTTPKPDRQFSVELSSPQNAQIGQATASGTILNYGGPNVTITGPGDVDEGAKGQRTPAVFTVNVAAENHSQTVEVDWRTEDGERAFAGQDYEADSGTLLFPPGTSSQQVQVMVVGNDRVDGNRQFRVVLDRPRFGRFPMPFNTDLGESRFRRVATATITDNDEIPVISIDDVEIVEGNSGTRIARFPVHLSRPTDANVLVDYRTFDGTAVAKGPNADYTKVGPTTLVIPAGQTSTTINVPVHGDTRPEDNEWFGVLLSEAKNAALNVALWPAPNPDNRRHNVARGTIINDDGPYLTITDVAKHEGADGERTAFDFTVRLHQAEPSTTLSVPWSTRDGTAQLFPADDIPGPDYEQGAGTLTFVPGGTTTRTIRVHVIGDNWPERTEYFFVDLRTPEPVNTDTAATLFKGTGVGTIINDDGPPMSIADGSVARSTTESVQVSLPVVISGRDDRNCSGGNCPPRAVRYRTLDGSAQAGEHYVAKEGTLTIPHQQGVDLHQGTITVEVLPAASDDPERTFEVELFWPDYARLVKPKATVTLQAGAAAPDPDDGGGGGPGPGDPDDPGTPGPPGPSDPDELIARSFGEGRIETAVAVSADHWNRADAAVLATAWRFPDALAGASLAAGLDAPLLLTDKEAVPPVVLAELQRLGVGTVWILGGPSAVSFEVEDSLKDAGYQVVRLHGPDRFATAVEVAKAVRLPPSGEVVLALGIHEQEHRAWPDALSAGALAASPDQIPTLLTRADEVPAITRQALDQLGARQVLLLGGTAAISLAVEQWLTTNGYEVVRLAGETRFGTSAAVASEALARWGTRALPVVFATGDNFPDGLAAGALAARVNGIVLLAPKDTLERAPEVRTFLEANRNQLTGGRIVGGPAAMSEDVQRQLAAAMGVS